MHKKCLILIAMIFLLSGCSSASREIVITDSSGQTGGDAAFLALSEEPSKDGGQSAAASESSSVDVVSKSIFIYVCGAVNEPGVYELPEGSRVVDAVDAAGGFTVEADETYVNLAATLEDGLKLRIPTSMETMPQDPGTGTSAGTKADAGAGKGQAKVEVLTKAIEGTDSSFDKESNLVNINSASVEELKTLPGIGDGIAGRIVDYRAECGGFSCIEDIMKISGIKDKLFQKIKDRIIV